MSSLDVLGNFYINVSGVSAAVRKLVVTSLQTVSGTLRIVGSGSLLDTTLSSPLTGLQISGDLVIQTTGLLRGFTVGPLALVSGNVALGLNANNASYTSNCANVAIGSNALPVLGALDGCNTAVGYESMKALTAGRMNTALGRFSMLNATNATSNTAIGESSLFNVVTGINNTALGKGAGLNITTGNNNVAIGWCAQVSASTASCELAIGFNATSNWLTGNSTKAIKPGAGIIDCANTCGTAGQVLMSNGANAVCWGNAAAPVATPTVSGTMCGTTINNLGGNVALGAGTLALAYLSCASTTAVGSSALAALPVHPGALL
jgi:hypothetical protein